MKRSESLIAARIYFLERELERMSTVADDAEALFCRGLAHSRLGHAREALADLTRSIELDPRDADAHLERAHCYERLGNTVAAHADRERARELDPGGDGEKE